MMRRALYATLFTAPLLVASISNCDDFLEKCEECDGITSVSVDVGVTTECYTYLTSFDGGKATAEGGIFLCDDQDETMMHRCALSHPEILSKEEKDFNTWKDTAGCTKSINLCLSENTVTGVEEAHDCELKRAEFSSSLSGAALTQLTATHDACGSCLGKIETRDESGPLTKELCEAADTACVEFKDFIKNDDCNALQDKSSSEDIGDGDSGEVVDKCTTDTAWDTCKNSENCKPFRDCLDNLSEGTDVDSTTCAATEDGSMIACYSECSKLVEDGCKNALLANANDDNGSGAENVAAGFAAAITAVVALFIA